jgi:hypothetical protein
MRCPSGGQQGRGLEGGGLFISTSTVFCAPPPQSLPTRFSKMGLESENQQKMKKNVRGGSATQQTPQCTPYRDVKGGGNGVKDPALKREEEGETVSCRRPMRCVAVPSEQQQQKDADEQAFPLPGVTTQPRSGGVGCVRISRSLPP